LPDSLKKGATMCAQFELYAREILDEGIRLDDKPAAGKETAMQ
jgi:hypothetical protein